MKKRQNFWIAVFAIGLSACQPAQLQTVRPTPLPQDAAVQVYMNHEPASQYTEPYRQQTRTGDDLEQVIVEAIAAAQSTIDIAVQELRLPKVAQALRDRHAAGVKVRVILENNYSRPFSTFKPAEVAKLPEREKSRYQEAVSLIDRNHDKQLSPEEISQGDALVILDNAKIPRIDDTADRSHGSHLMHHKFIVIDGQIVIVTSANFTTSDIHGDFASPQSRGNANNLLKIASIELAELFSEEFNLMWGDGPGGKPDSLFGTKKPARPVRQVKVGETTIAVHFSPNAKATSWSQSSNGLIAKTLSMAEQSINLALFVFSDQQLVNQIEPKHEQGREIRALIDPAFLYRSYSEGLDMLGVELRDNCQVEANNHPWQNPITTVGVPRMPPGDLLHHKFGIVDRKIVITGSHNWTNAANHDNDETLLVIQSPVVAAHYQREFERLYADAILGVPPAIEKKVAAGKQCPRSTQPQSKPATVPADDPESTALDQVPENQLSKHSIPGKGDSLHPSPPRQENRHPQQNAPHSVSHGRQHSQLKSVSPSASDRPVNLNTASAAEIDALPGIGPGLTKRIIAARQQKRFTSLADLDRVPGVGPKLLKKLQDKVTW